MGTSSATGGGDWFLPDHCSASWVLRWCTEHSDDGDGDDGGVDVDGDGDGNNHCSSEALRCWYIVIIIINHNSS